MDALFGGYSPNKKEPGGNTDEQLLEAAAENDPTPLIRFVKAGGDPFRVRNEERRSLVHVAAFDGCEDALAALLQFKGSVRKIDSRDRAKRTALHLAAAAGEDGCIRRLVAAGAMLEVQDEYGCTPLHLAIKWEWAEAARVLLELGSDPCAEDLKGYNALDMAGEVQDKEVATVLMSFEPRRRASAWKCLVPLWRNGARARRAKAYADTSHDTDAATFQPPSPAHRATGTHTGPSAMRPFSSEALAPVAAQRGNQVPAAQLGNQVPATQLGNQTTARQAAPRERELRADSEVEGSPQVQVVCMSDGDSDYGQGVQRPHDALEGPLVDDQWYQDWYSMDDKTLQANIAAAMTEAAQQQDAYDQRNAVAPTQMQAGESELEAASRTPDLRGPTGKGYRVEWHGLEPVYVDADGNMSSAEGADIVSQHSRGAGVGLMSGDRPLSAREWTPSTEPQTVGRTRAGSAPPATRVETGKQMPSHADIELEQEYISADEETADEGPAADAEIMMHDTAVVTHHEEELTEDFIFRLCMLFEQDVKSLEFQVNWQDDMLPAVGIVKEGGEADRRGILQGDSIDAINGVPTAGKVREDLLPLLKVRPLTLQVGRCHRVVDPRSPYLQLHFVLEGASGNHGFKVAATSQLPVVTAIQPGSAAARSGLLQGDQISRAGGYDARGMPQDALVAKLQERPLQLVVKRPPIGHEAINLHDGGHAGNFSGSVLEQDLPRRGPYPRESWDSDED